MRFSADFFLILFAFSVLMAGEPYQPPWEMTTYVFGMLTRGDQASEFSEEQLKELQAGHMANIQRMADAGKLRGAGPMGDDGELRGIFIFRVDSVGEARALAAADPSIRAGRLKLDLFTWYGPKGIGDQYFAAVKKSPGREPPMIQLQLGILKKGPNRSEEDTTRLQELQAAHLAHIDRMAASRKLLAAGPFLEDTDVRGIFVFNNGPDEAAELASADPAVQAGRLVVELHPWWVAKGVVPTNLPLTKTGIPER